MQIELFLEQLARAPQSQAQLQSALSWSSAQIELALRHLERAGYLTAATPEQGLCQSGCGMCSVKNFCPTHQHQEESWRLTPKGVRHLARK